MEKLVQKLNEKYQDFKSFDLDNYKGCISFIYGKQEEINQYIENSLYQKNVNKRDSRLSSFLLYVPLVPVFKTPEFFKEDNLDIDLGIDVCVDYIQYCNKMIEVITDNTYGDICKLSAFMSELYDYNMHQLESNRARRERYYYGEEEFGFCQLVNKDAVDIFFEQQINSICKKERVEKVKK